jgi:8-hydroxy-5-deazaflavin:NADPH oxidoreductase
VSVAILGGTGDLGYGLAVRLAHAGVAVAIGSRDAARAEDAAARASAASGGSVHGAANADAARGAEIVVVAVPFAAQAATLTAVADVLDGQILLDATVPLATAIGGKPTRVVGVWAGSSAQQAQEIVADKARVVSGLHTVSAASLMDLGHDLDEHVLLCGDRKADKEAAAAVVERIPGLRCVDVGRLELSRFVEQLTPLLISINIRHKTHAGIRITGV